MKLRCINPHAYPTALTRGRVYETAEPEPGDDHGQVAKALVRVLDDNGESYLYPRDLFEEVPPAVTVFLIWQNDALLDVYGTREAAEVRLLRVMQENAGEPWRHIRGGRWHQPDGRIARLEVEERAVRSC